MLIDATARQSALDVTKSFIVEAPAGSGKTELLAQRFLSLLNVVEKKPEEVLAITFTRKAAGEMRNRIIRCLEFALENGERPEENHMQTTWRLARQVILRDQQQGWHLLDNPNRLNIQTIDALCTSLTKRLPVLAGMGVGHDIVEDARDCYARAADRTLDELEEGTEWADKLEHLLLVFDNNRELLQILIQEMLASREQWLPYCLAGNTAAIREQLEQGLKKIVSESLAESLAAMDSFFPKMQPLIEFAVRELQAFDAEHGLHIWQSNPEWSDTFEVRYCQAIAIANWLLTKQGEVRNKPSKQQGFPAPSAAKSADRKHVLKAMKSDMVALLSEIQSSETCRQALNSLKQLPNLQYSEPAWETLSSLMTVLPIATAHLKLVFQQDRAVDFIEIAQSALLALGEPMAPTDLALALDYRYSHILVDEFQDTSITQYQLLEKLTLGWQPDDGRTLFVVGDPMQSIYRFRQAEVGLFLRVQQQGLGDIHLETLSLKANFRSSYQLIDWFNQAFPKIFPKKDDISLSCVSYHPCHAMLRDKSGGVEVHPVVDNLQAEALQVVTCVEQSLQIDSQQTVAILVRARTHLMEICPLLDAKGIAYNGVDIKPLHRSIAVQDCVSLTRALCHLGDRLAWLSILRAPWCGLSLADCHIISQEDTETDLILDKLQNPSILQQLSDGARNAIARFLPIMLRGLAVIERVPLRRCVEATWLALGAHDWVEQTERYDVTQYFQMLQDMATGSQRLLAEDIEKKLSERYSETKSQQANVHIMTIHKAKGLEFDTVIIPGIGRRGQHESHRLMNWIELTTQHGDNCWVLAPYVKAFTDDDGIYAYIHGLHKQKAKAELIRLLYVAMTRAKKSCHLIGAAKTNESGQLNAESGSFLALLWPVVATEFHDKDLPWLPGMDEAIEEVAQLKRLAENWQSPHLQKVAAIKQPLNENPTDPSHYRWRLDEERIIGNILHRIVYEVAQAGLEHDLWQDEQALHRHLAALCYHYGLSQSVRESRTKQLLHLVKRILASEAGQWILSEKSEARNEYAITGLVSGKLMTGIIDRTFVVDGQRWLIDYKFVLQHPVDADSFFMQQKKQYAQQLRSYSELLAKNQMPVDKVVLYFPILEQLVELNPWDCAIQSGQKHAHSYDG